MHRFMQARLHALATGTAGPKRFRAETMTVVPGAAVTGPVGEMWMYDFIDPWGVSAVDTVAALMAIGPGDVVVHINSPGGDVFEGLAIYNNLRAHPGNVHVRIEGVAASAASFIAMAGNTVTIEPNAMMMIHDAAGMEFGPEAVVRKFADLLGMTSANLASIYAERTGGDPKAIRAAMLEETWYVGQGAVDAGLADAVSTVGPVDATASGFSSRVDLSLYNNAPAGPAGGVKIIPMGEPFGTSLSDKLVSDEDIDFEAIRQAFREVRL